jgi:hypothetical protein
MALPLIDFLCIRWPAKHDPGLSGELQALGYGNIYIYKARRNLKEFAMHGDRFNMVLSRFEVGTNHNVSVHLVPGFISSPANTILAISNLKLYNAT